MTITGILFTKGFERFEGFEGFGIVGFSPREECHWEKWFFKVLVIVKQWANGNWDKTSRPLIGSCPNWDNGRPVRCLGAAQNWANGRPILIQVRPRRPNNPSCSPPNWTNRKQQVFAVVVVWLEDRDLGLYWSSLLQHYNPVNLCLLIWRSLAII